MFNIVKSLAVMITACFLVACASSPKRVNDLNASSVKITNLAGNSGGSGIVLRSSPTNSYVLTNAHVCGVVVNGGMVSGEAGQFTVSAYKKSEASDLCLIKVAGDLEYDTKLAKKLPKLYSEEVAISGHPALMPTVITEGRFSGREVIPILVGVKPCTPEDMEDPNKAPACIFLGGLPVIKNFESILASATIMPGSSGSGVYNKDGELSGVVFAGQGSLGYAWTVPYEQVLNFLFKEQRHLKYERPTNTTDLFGGRDSKSNSDSVFFSKLKKACESPMKEQFEKLCNLLDSDVTKR